jgi:hypothetical protein
MALDPALAAAITGLNRELANLSARLTQVEQNQRTSQLGNSSIENGSLTFNDATGTPQVVLGLQPDGSFAHASVTSQVPVAPDTPVASPGVLSALVTWDGLMSDGSAPLADFAGVQVHASTVSGYAPDATTLQGGMPGQGSFGVGGLTAGTTYYAVLVAYNNAGNTSQPSAQAAVTPQSVPQNIPPGAISGLQIATGAITSAQLAANAGVLGSQIANQTITGANIAANSVSANMLTAGIVIGGVIDGTVVNAPIVNGGVINGVQINATNIVGGTISGSTFTGSWGSLNNNGFFLYSPTAATGNLVFAATPGSGTDPYGNAYQPGVNIQGTDGQQYVAGTRVQRTTSTVLINQLPASPIVILNPLVGVSVYQFVIQIVYLCASSAGTPEISFGGGSTVSLVVGSSYFSGSVGGSITLARVLNGPASLIGVAFTGPTMVASGTFAFVMSGLISFSAGGTFTVYGSTSNTSDTWQVGTGSYATLILTD